MKVLVVGNGGREHALAWKIKQSPVVDRLYVARGNAGIWQIAEKVDISPTDIPALVKFAKEEKIDLTVVGPEQPLSEGIVDVFEEENLKIFGHRKSSAILEASKVFAKNFMKKYGIPTAFYETFDNEKDAIDFVKKQQMPIVIKADGLAAGKGVIIANTLDEAIQTIKDMFRGKFGEASKRIVIEEFLDGEEASYIAMVKGEKLVPMATSQDHKRVFDGDKGPNTGGMGAYSPAPIVDEKIEQEILEKIMYPTLKGMKKEGRELCGFLYAGLMIGSKGINVLEFNVRMGDPETQPIMRRLESDLVQHILDILDGNIDKVKPKWSNKYSIGVVMASKGYPGKYEKGFEITGIEEAEKDPDIVVFHSGTDIKDGKLVTNGGRVLTVTAVAETLKKAKEKVYKAVEKIHFKGAHYRKDIGDKGIKRLENI
ncbi:phosphoribosylamine--glycine ligase [Hydrogenothermus marinus]|uniref:Phosphoribosylamine--glycine ligase n=1 Tax=Hydrogenothermus marinus TaxID=133270 RepID=A0A3M0BMT0_9AQUI|nr:phosphoribosylamine--glycine ligase [Hydrogenothermus marinus]RMA96128.1 phosphoribosylamine--glycine ligase [Hydrogenothermus marinus]